VREQHHEADLREERDGAAGVLAERWLAYLVAAAGVVALFNAFVPGFQGYDVTGLVAIALGAFTVAAVLLSSRGRLPQAWLHAFVAAGSAGIGAGIHFTAGVPNAASMLYLWVTLYAFYFFSRRAAVVHVVIVGIS
jgi:hypothetical protein